MRPFQDQELRSVLANQSNRIKAKVEGYSIGGKTGTAQKLPRGTGKYLVSFIGCAPAEEPEVVIYAIVDEPNAANQAQSTFAQELCRDILKEVLPFLDVHKIGDKREEDEDDSKQNTFGENGEKVNDSSVMGEDNNNYDNITQDVQNAASPLEDDDEDSEEE